MHRCRTGESIPPTPLDQPGVSSPSRFRSNISSARPTTGVEVTSDNDQIHLVTPSRDHPADQLEHGLLLYRLCRLELVHIADQKGGIRPRVGHLDEVCMLEGSWSALRHCFILRSDVKKGCSGRHVDMHERHDLDLSRVPRTPPWSSSKEAVRW